MKHLKDQLRRDMLGRRDALSPEQVRLASEGIMKGLFSAPRFSEAKTIGFYLPKGKEVDTRQMITAAMRKGKEVFVPVTSKKIEFHPFSSFDDLKEGKYGILEPKTRVRPGIDPDVVIVPGVAFGLCMHRLGYGKGYYDDFLSSSHAYRIGICYDFQVVEKLPSHGNDQRMDEIITENRVIT